MYAACGIQKKRNAFNDVVKEKYRVYVIWLINGWIQQQQKRKKLIHPSIDSLKIC
jgi:hypothetical protein